MRFRVDPTVCEAFGNCADVAPSVFALDDWGYAQADDEDIAKEPRLALAQEALRKCPVSAIRAVPDNHSGVQ